MHPLSCLSSACTEHTALVLAGSRRTAERAALLWETSKTHATTPADMAGALAQRRRACEGSLPTSPRDWSELSAQYAPRVQPKEPDFGAGRIPASAAKQHLNEYQTMCGCVTQVSKDGIMNFGNSGVYGMHGADLIAYAPAGIDVAPYFGTVACVSGHIQVKSFERSSPGIPVVYVKTPQTSRSSAAGRRIAARSKYSVMSRCAFNPIGIYRILSPLPWMRKCNAPSRC
jgi:hypothetical protein